MRRALTRSTSWSRGSLGKNKVRFDRQFLDQFEKILGTEIHFDQEIIIKFNLHLPKSQFLIMKHIKCFLFLFSLYFMNFASMKVLHIKRHMNLPTLLFPAANPLATNKNITYN